MTSVFNMIAESWEPRDIQGKSHHTLWMRLYSTSTTTQFKVKTCVDTTKTIALANLFTYTKTMYYYIIV